MYSITFCNCATFAILINIQWEDLQHTRWQQQKPYKVGEQL